MNLDGYIAGSEVVATKTTSKAFRNTALLEGSMYGLPWDGETTGLFYRTDLFERAGIDGPPETWAEFEETAAALTDPSENQYGVAMFASEAAYYWYPWLWQAGGDLLSSGRPGHRVRQPRGHRGRRVLYGPRAELRSAGLPRLRFVERARDVREREGRDVHRRQLVRRNTISSSRTSTASGRPLRYRRATPAARRRSRATA